MQSSCLVPGALALGLAACVSATPLELSPDNPANPRAPSGQVGGSTALDDYKSPTDFQARAAADRATSEHAMPSMQHGGMAGMQHGGAPQGAPSR
jgi:hypothetical protein